MTRQSTSKAKPLPEYTRIAIRDFANRTGALEIVLKGQQTTAEKAGKVFPYSFVVQRLNELRTGFRSGSQGRKTNAEIVDLNVALLHANDELLRLVGTLSSDVQRVFMEAHRKVFPTDGFLDFMRAQFEKIKRVAFEEACLAVRGDSA
jgi:hypothetical protein